MFDTVRIAPSVLSADFMNMAADLRSLEDSGADWVHIDVMDGHFVPNLTMGVPFVSQIKPLTTLPLDVHLMIDNPLTQLPWFLKDKPAYVTVHLEALDAEAGQVQQALDMIHDAGVKAGISLKPDTPVDKLAPYISQLDMVLIMSVYPGFSGQSYIEGSDNRVAQVVDLCKQAHVAPLIQVDGGINPQTASLVCAAGADVLVAGSGFFGAQDRSSAVRSIRDAGTAAAKDAR